MAGKRRFGRVRRPPSGRFQARYLGPDGKDELGFWLERAKVRAKGIEPS